MTNLNVVKSPLTAVVFSSYPFKNPRHGGQLRCSKLVSAFSNYFARVIPVAVYNSLVYSSSDANKWDIASPQSTNELINAIPQLEAWYLGESPVTTQEVREHISRILLTHKPDVLIFEQPYLYRSVMALCQELELDPIVINSTQNFETPMLKSILESTSASEELRAEYSSRLDQLLLDEEQLALNSAGSIAVSDLDAAEVKKLGSTNVLIAANGVDFKKSSANKSARINRILAEDHTEVFGLFVGSAHRPNVTGFIDTLGSRLGYLPEHSEIFFAGGVGQEIRNYLLANDGHYGEFFWNRARDWGQVSNETLSGLISQAQCILLPITTGGGSNLKTAEAILSGRPIVATAHAFRGFEKFIELPGVFIAPTSDQFKLKVKELLESDFIPTDVENDDLRHEVTWDFSLNKVVPWLHETVQNRKAK